MRDVYKIALVLVLLAIGVAAFYNIYQQRQSNQRNFELAEQQPAEVDSAPQPKVYPELTQAIREERNAELGLPADYPLGIIPLYAGSDVLETELGEAESSDGEPMRKWVIQAETDGAQQEVFDYYQGVMSKLNLRQTLYISKPGTHGVDFGVHFADENFDVRFEIERRRDDTRTQLKIEVYRLAN